MLSAIGAWDSVPTVSRVYTPRTMANTIEVKAAKDQVCYIMGGSTKWPMPLPNASVVTLR